MKKIALLVMLLIADTSTTMNYDISAKILKATGGALYNKLDRVGLAKDYTHDFIQKIEGKANANYQRALNYVTAFCESDGIMNCWQFLQWCFFYERREYVRHLKTDRNFFLSHVTGLAFTYPVWLSDEKWVYFVNTAYERKLRGEFKPIELYYAHMICPESSRTKDEHFVYIHVTDIITPEIGKKLEFICIIPE